MKQDLEEDWAVGEPNFHSTQADNTLLKKNKILSAEDSLNGASVEDWSGNTMVNGGILLNPPNPKNSANQTADALNTNPLIEEKQNKWQMPEPVFRVSNGKKVEKPALAEDNANSPISPPKSAEIQKQAPDIQPQPYISEAFIVSDEDIIEEPPAKVENNTKRIILIFAGILAMILFAVGFLIGIYFLVFHNFE